MATTSVRGAVVQQLQTIAVGVLPLRKGDTTNKVPFSTGYPGKNIESEHVWVAHTIGDETHPEMSGPNRWRRRDDFTITVEVQANAPGQTDIEAYLRAETIFASLEDALANKQNLNALDGVITAHVAHVEGPNTYPTDEGWQAYVMFELVCSSHLL